MSNDSVFIGVGRLTSDEKQVRFQYRKARKGKVSMVDNSGQYQGLRPKTFYYQYFPVGKITETFTSSHMHPEDIERFQNFGKKYSELQRIKDKSTPPSP